MLQSVFDHPHATLQRSWCVQVQHKEQSIKLVAEFLSIELTPELLDIAMEQSDHQVMAANPCKYDDHPVKLRRNEAMGRPRYAGVCGAPSLLSTTPAAQVCFQFFY
jgi:hypothetical protein